jgi:xanthine/CO dehydrogenase XdhC/CoxF family maturation factor
MKEIRDIISAFEKQSDAPLALATLVRAQGSSYRRPGARMLIGLGGTLAGSLSGGCLEEEVAAVAREVLQMNQPRVIAFDTRRRFGCHGRIEIFVEPLPREFLPALAKCQRARRSCTVSVNFEDSTPAVGTKMLPAGAAALVNSFVQQIDPPIRLIIIGEGPDSTPLRGFSDLLGWELLEIQDAAQLAVPLDRWTAAVVKSHNFGRDFAALAALLPQNLPYVGLIGPRKRRDRLLAELFERLGALNAELFAPAGLDLGSETPEEIALAIVAEIQSVLAGASQSSLRQRKVAIHDVSAWVTPRAGAAAAR